MEHASCVLPQLAAVDATKPTKAVHRRASLVGSITHDSARVKNVSGGQSSSGLVQVVRVREERAWDNPTSSSLRGDLPPPLCSRGPRRATDRLQHLTRHMRLMPLAGASSPGRRRTRAFGTSTSRPCSARSWSCNGRTRRHGADDLVFCTSRGTPYLRGKPRKRVVGKAVERANAALAKASMKPITTASRTTACGGHSRRCCTELARHLRTSWRRWATRPRHWCSRSTRKKMARSRDTGERMDALLRGADWGWSSARKGVNGTRRPRAAPEETEVPA